MVCVEFSCKCGKQTGCITDNEITEPCPNCGRKYKGEYSKEKLTIIPTEIKDPFFKGYKPNFFFKTK